MHRLSVIPLQWCLEIAYLRQLITLLIKLALIAHYISQIQDGSAHFSSDPSTFDWTGNGREAQGTNLTMSARVMRNLKEITDGIGQLVCLEAG